MPTANGQEPAAIPPAPAGFDKPRDGIQRGQVETKEYESKSVGARRKLLVYTPPGYDREQRYPVLYLLHGIGDDEQDWVRKGEAAAILDNLIAEKKAEPMIVIMPNGRAAKEDRPGGDFRKQFEAFGAFQDDLINDILPFVAANYAVADDRERRALAGLSMGGGQSLNIGLANRDKFAWIGGFSSAPNTRPAAELIGGDRDDGTKALKLLWLSCGDEDRLLDVSTRFHDALEKEKVAHVWHVEEGGHTWAVWKNDLYLFASRLFR